MKVKDLKVLLPGAPLLVAALVLGVAAFWYMQRAEQQADHVVRRNFNHLNQIAANMAAVREGLQNQVFFECDHALAKLQGSDNARREISKVFGRLAENSTLVQGPASVRVSEPDPERDKAQKSYTSETCSSESTGPDATLEIIALGTKLAIGGLESRFLLRSALAREPAVHRLLSITQGFELIEGLGQSAGYFDTILLGAHGDEGSWVYYNTAVAKAAVPEDDILALFDATHDYARFGSLAAFAQATRIFDLELEDIAGKGRTGTDNRAGESWSSHSRLLSIPVGSERKRAFSQPLTLSFLAPTTFSSTSEDPPRPVIIGLMEEAEFNRLKFQLPLNVVLVLVLLLLAGILSFSLLRLKLLAGHAVLRRVDVLLAGFSTVGLALLTTVMLSNGLASWFLSAQYKADLEDIHGEILSTFYAERGEKLAYLRRVIESASDAGSPPLHTPGGVRKTLLAPADDVFRVRQWTGDGLPIFTELFLLDKTGRNVGNFVTFDKKNEDLEPGFKVPSREYFRALSEGRAWRSGAEGAHRRYYLQRIEDLVSGVLRTAISLRLYSGEMPLPVESPFKADTPLMLVGTTQFHSLAHTAMPPGYGFAVFDRLSGDVLFHSDGQRSLRENLFRATDDAPLLKAAVIANLERKELINLSYKGDSIRARLAPLRGTNWELLTFYDRGLVDIVNFRFSAAVLGVSALALFAIPLASAALAALWLTARAAYSLRSGSSSYEPARLPPWLFPAAAEPAVHRVLTFYYALLLWLYVGVILVLDLGSSYLWVMYVLLATPFLWWLLCRQRGGPRQAAGDNAAWNGNVRAWGAAPHGRKEGSPDPARSPHLLLRDLRAIASGRAPFSLPFLTFSAAWLVLVFYCSPDGNRAAIDTALFTSAAFGLLGLLLLLPQYASTAIAAEGGDKHGDDTPTPAFNYACVIWYRLQLCLLVLLLIVAPALLLQSESYDVHERSWWDFHSWAVGDRLAARNRALQRHIDGLSTAPDFRLDQWLWLTDQNRRARGLYLRRHVGALATAPGLRLDQWMWLTAVEDGSSNRRGLYLPRFSINEPMAKDAGPERIGLTVFPRDGRAPGVRRHGAGERPHLPNQLERRVDTGRLGDVARWSPTFSTIGTTLREFIGVDQYFQTDSVKDRANENSWGGRYLADQLDERAGILFEFSYYYPHTRAHPVRAAGFHFLMIVVAAVVVLLLLGFVLRRMLLTSELHGEKYWDDSVGDENERGGGVHDKKHWDDAARIKAGNSAVLIVPARQEPGAVLERLEAALLGATANSQEKPARLRGGTVLKFETRRVLLVADLVAAVTDSEASKDILELIEDAQATGFAVILLSDVHPTYWLEHWTGADDLSGTNFNRWERCLRQLPIYRYRNGATAEAGVVDYRRVWERSSKDEQLVLASVFYEGLAPTLNPDTLESLVSRGVLCARDQHLEFAGAFLGEKVDDWGRFVRANLPRTAFLRQARQHETGLWRAVRGPFVLVLLTLLAFLAYVARDELQGLLSLAVGLGATMAALSTVGERWRTVMGSLGGGNSSGS